MAKKFLIIPQYKMTGWEIDNEKQISQRVDCLYPAWTKRAVCQFTIEKQYSKNQDTDCFFAFNPDNKYHFFQKLKLWISPKLSFNYFRRLCWIRSYCHIQLDCVFPVQKKEKKNTLDCMLFIHSVSSYFICVWYAWISWICFSSLCIFYVFLFVHNFTGL